MYSLRLLDKAIIGNLQRFAEDTVVRCIQLLVSIKDRRQLGLRPSAFFCNILSRQIIVDHMVSYDVQHLAH